MNVRPYSSALDGEWDALVDRAPVGTFLHTRRFLAYHGDRFRDVSVMLHDRDGQVNGVFPAAVDPDERDRVVSHPGLTYGGVIHDGTLLGNHMVDTVRAIAAFYRAQGFRVLRYKAVPLIYHRGPAQDDVYALFRLGARCYRRDLAASIDLRCRRHPSERRRRGIKKARKAGVTLQSGTEWIPHLWTVLEENLWTRHGTRPVHTAMEMLRLHSWFPDNISTTVALLDGSVVAGVTLFWTPSVCHVQYTAASTVGRAVAALDLVLEHLIESAEQRGRRYFDFGVSTEQDGRVLNDGLYTFKTEFGASGVVHDHYELSLENP